MTVTNRVLTQVIHGDVSEASVVNQPAQIGGEAGRRARTSGGDEDDEDGAEADARHEGAAAGAGAAAAGAAADTSGRPARRKRGKQSGRR